MIWLFLAVWAAATLIVVWGLVGHGPWMLALAVVGAWMVGRGLIAALGRGRAQAAGAGNIGRALTDAIAGQGTPRGAGPDPETVAALAINRIEEAMPGAGLELWLVDGSDQWRRARGGDALTLPFLPPDVRRWLGELTGPVPRELLAEVGDFGAELARRGAGRLAMPLFYGGRLLGLLWASGPDGLELLLAGARRPIEEALGHARLVRRVAQQTVVAAEVELAAAVQQAIIPGREMQRLGPLELAGSYMPASRCGGDFWACHDLGSDRALVLIGDVTGHGIGSARITAAARGAHDVVVQVQKEQLALPSLFDALDAAVRRVGAGHYHMTCFAAVVDGRRRVRYAGAGHVSPYVCRVEQSGNVAIDALVGRGNPLGMGASRPSVEVSERQLMAGDLLLFYSDGLADTSNPAGERLSERRVHRLMRQLAATTLGVEDMRDRVEDMVREFAATAPLADDITFVVARVG